MPGTPPTWAGILPLLNVMICDPPLTGTVPLPQVVFPLGVGAIEISPPPMVVKLSVRDTPVIGAGFVLDRVIVRVERPPGLTAFG